MDAFYQTFGAAGFTLAGLWLVIVDHQWERWAADPARRRMAYAVFLHFILPGTMSVLALVGSTAVWRVSFCVTAVAGAAAALLIRRAGVRGAALSTALVVAAVVYLAIAATAVIPATTVEDAGGKPLQVEGVLVTLVVLLGANLAWLASFDEGDAS